MRCSLSYIAFVCLVATTLVSAIQIDSQKEAVENTLQTEALPFALPKPSAAVTTAPKPPASAISNPPPPSSPPAVAGLGGKSSDLRADVVKRSEAHLPDSQIHPSGVTAIQHKSRNTHVYLVNNNMLSEDRPTINFGEEFQKASEESRKKHLQGLDSRKSEEVQKDKQEQAEKDKQVKQEDDQKNELIQKNKQEQTDKGDPCKRPERKFVPNPTAVTAFVDARKNSVQGAGYPVDTGVYVKKGTAISMVASGMWYAVAGGAGTDANGYKNAPQYNFNGLNTFYGTLVGRIGNGAYFVIGADFFSCKMDQEGRLFLVYWDSDSENNAGTIQVTIKYQQANEEKDSCFKKQVTGGTQKTVSVGARENSVSEAGKPLETNCWLTRNDPVRITANGEWYASVGSDLLARPDGVATPWNGIRFFSLVGRVGASGWFFVGSDFFSCNLPAEGPLQLGYWDSDSNNNRGSVSATITYLRKNAALEDQCASRKSNGAQKQLDVFARQNSANGGRPADSGVDVVQGKPLKITASGTWYAAPNGQLQSGPDGWNQLYGSQGLTANAFSLIGRIGNGPLFFVGSDYYSCYPTQSGRLTFVYWDSDADNNSGSVRVTISH